MIHAVKFVFNPFQVNTYLIYNGSKEAFVVDPACYDDSEKKVLSDYIDRQELTVKSIINTHCHIDHILGVEYLRKKYKTEFWCSEEDQFLIDNSEAQGDFFGFKVEKPSKPDRYLNEGEYLNLGGDKIQIYHIPGHSPGSLVFYLVKEKKVITGDVLFAGSIGRTDLPGGDYQILVNGIVEKLLRLNDDVEVLPGHGPASTIGQEKLTNPFLQ